MLDDERSRSVVLIFDGVDGALAQLAGLGHHTFGNFHALKALRFTVAGDFDQQAEVRRVRNDAALAWFDRVGQTFASEHFVFEDTETSSVRVSELVFFSQRPRNGRPEPFIPLQSETFSASISACAIGTRAD